MTPQGELPFRRSCPGCGADAPDDQDALLDTGWVWIMGRDVGPPLVAWQVLVCPICDPVKNSRK